MKTMVTPSNGPMMHCCTQCPQPCGRPPPTHASTGDSWTLTGKSGQSLMGSLLLSSEAFACALQEPVPPGLCKFWRLYGGVNGNLLQEGLCHSRVYFHLLEWIKVQKHDNALSARLCGEAALSWMAGGRAQCPQRLNCQYLSKLDMQLFSGSAKNFWKYTL